MLKKYGQFIKESNEDIDSICQKFGINNYTINSDGSVDIDVDVYLDNSANDFIDKPLTEIPLKFGKVTGDFECNMNNLTSLKGCPQLVGGYFDCRHNKLTSLEGSPKKVGGNFYCQNNKLTSLKGAPDKVNFFNCSFNNIISFKYLPLASGYNFNVNPIHEFLKYFDNYNNKKNLGEYLKLFEDIVQYPYLDDLEFEELAKSLKHELPENWRDSVTSYKMLSQL